MPIQHSRLDLTRPLTADDCFSDEVWHIYANHCEDSEEKVAEAYTPEYGALLAASTDLAQALDALLTITFDAMHAAGEFLTDEELEVEAQARAALAKAFPETP